VEVVGSSGGGSELWRQRQGLKATARSGGVCRPSPAIELHLLPAIQLLPAIHFLSPPPACDLALAHYPTYACYPARHRCAWVSPPRLIVLVEVARVEEV
jgi:hypothetical protein